MKKMFLPLILLLVAAISQAQDADAIIEKHLAAIGGKENWKKVNSLIMEGALNVMGREVNVKMYQLHQKGIRQDISLAGMTGYQINTPTGGWAYMPFQGQTKPEPMTPDDVKESLDDLDLQGNLLDYKQKGHQVEYLGTEDVEGTDCLKLKVIRKNSGEQTLYFDPATYYIIRSVSKRQAMGREMEVRTDMSDYREIKGIKVPYSITQPFGTLVLSSIKVNEEVDEKLLADPTK